MDIYAFETGVHMQSFKTKYMLLTLTCGDNCSVEDDDISKEKFDENYNFESR